MALGLILSCALWVHADEPYWLGWQEGFAGGPSGSHVAPSNAAANPEAFVEVTAHLPYSPYTAVSQYRGYRVERCPACHTGVEEIDAYHPRAFGCTVCHGGDGSSVDKDQAHSTLIYDPKAGTGKRNPSNLGVVQTSCGLGWCHSGHFDDDRNQVRRVKKSMMGTLAGMVAGLRYQWGGQADRTSRFGALAIEDRDGYIPAERGAVAQLKTLPQFSLSDVLKSAEAGESKPTYYSRHIGDRLLRESCFQCHIDSPPGPGQNRSQGCAACHMTHSDSGLYEGGDPTVSKTEPGRPALHRMTALPPNRVCVQCHQSFSDSAPAKEQKFPGAGNPVSDAHIAAGMECIDCHTQNDIMGDGNLYSRQHQAVEIRCETCHGDGRSYPDFQEITDQEDSARRSSRYYQGFKNEVGDFMALTARSRKMTNVKMINDEVFTYLKRSGKALPTPAANWESEAHAIPGHRNRLECVACHSQRAPRCSGCHITLDQSRRDGSDKKNEWSDYRFDLEWKEPVLMVGPNGKIAPMLPQPDRLLTALDKMGRPIRALNEHGEIVGEYKDWHFTNPDGYSGSRPAHAFSPHAVGKTVRSCASCHLNPKALGLGSGPLTISRFSSGKNDAIQPTLRTEIVKGNSKQGADAKVTARGRSLAGSHQPGARPLNQKELNRILKVGTCLPCHDSYDDPIYRDVQASYRFARRIEHREMRNKILNPAVLNPIQNPILNPNP